ncbi:MAG: DUF5615 family PIN-like protein [Anaerolineae bacterium]|nr:DUF5615 family PIN-like protein [Anaerolineae bacterium]
MAQLYSNENFPRQVVEELRQLGHDVLTTQEAGNAGQAVPDEAVLDFAAKNNRTLLTINRKHFIRLHQNDASHSGIIVCTFDPDFIAQAQRIDLAIKAHPQLAGQLIRVNRPPQ